MVKGKFDKTWNSLKILWKCLSTKFSFSFYVFIHIYICKKAVVFRLEFNSSFQKCPKTTLKCFQYEVSNSLERSDKKLTIKANFYPFFQFNSSNFRLKQCQKPQSYQICQKKLSLKESGKLKTKSGFQRQSVTKYVRLTLVFRWKSALQEKFDGYFSGIFCYY